MLALCFSLGTRGISRGVHARVVLHFDPWNRPASMDYQPFHNLGDSLFCISNHDSFISFELAFAWQKSYTIFKLTNININVFPKITDSTLRY